MNQPRIRAHATCDRMKLTADYTNEIQNFRVAGSAFTVKPHDCGTRRFTVNDYFVSRVTWIFRLALAYDRIERANMNREVTTKLTPPSPFGHRDWAAMDSAPRSTINDHKATRIYIQGYCPDETAADPQGCVCVVWWEPFDNCWMGEAGNPMRPIAWQQLSFAPTADELEKIGAI